MKQKKVVVLPMDGYANGQALMAALIRLLDEPGFSDSISHIKFNDAIHNPDFGGPAIVRVIQSELAKRDLDIKIFLDLKIFDVSATLENVLKKYIESPPDILTVCSKCSVDGILKLKKLLPKTKLAIVSVLTDIDELECSIRFGHSPEVEIYTDLININRALAQKIGDFGSRDKLGLFDLIVCSPHELPFLRRNLPDTYGFIVPGIRDEWMKKKDEHQKRITGVRQALDGGATHVVMGAQMTKGNPEMDISPEQSRKLTKQAISLAKTQLVVKGDSLATLKLCGGYYKSPQDKEGNFLGPLVGYAGTYDSDAGPKNYVGFEYFNFAKAEALPIARSYFARLIGEEIKKAGLQCDVVVGAPMGGILLAGSLGDYLQCRTIFAEKKVTGLANKAEGIKEQSEQIIDRHEIRPGDRVIIVEDVCNNFSTTKKMETLVSNLGGKLVAIVCAFNRSGNTDWESIPVLSGLSIPTQQFRQDDPEVVELIKQEEIVWKPKLEWDRLKRAMEV
jgi:orotidine-5'-phosphate decarboxylase